ncbi:alkaline phosphatase family protein, partial [Candidatus Dojkabacteria bacterium]|nr:alkaline phosphatase family protein [Candidatus Dojkabacteria bacterium]
SIYSELKQDDIIINTYANSKFTPSPFTDAVIKQDANVIAFDDYKQGLEMLTNDALQNKAKRTYSYFYLDEVDGTSHKFGPESEEFMQSATTHLEDIMKIFVNRVEGKINNALFVLMADHGQMAVDIDNPSYINQLVPNIEDYLHRSKAGRPLIPAGSARDMFLYAKNESREELQNILNEKLAGKAEIIQTEQLLENNIFGLDAPTKDFLDRVGNLVIFPYEKQAVWWYEPEVFEINHVGMHGGLSIDEMEIPLALLEL